MRGQSVLAAWLPARCVSLGPSHGSGAAVAGKDVRKDVGMGQGNPGLCYRLSVLKTDCGSFALLMNS